MVLGNNAGVSGSYTLNGGSLASSNEYIGYLGTGNVAQTGGANSVAAALYLGNCLAEPIGYPDYSAQHGSGSYTLSGSGSLTAANEYLGYGSSGSFAQSGGSNAMSGALFIGNTVNFLVYSYPNYIYATFSGSGSYNLSGSGLLSASAEFIGNGIGSNDTFTQSGGTTCNRQPGAGGHLKLHRPTISIAAC